MSPSTEKDLWNFQPGKEIGVKKEIKHNVKKKRIPTRKKIGDAGDRSQDLLHAKQTLYR